MLLRIWHHETLSDAQINCAITVATQNVPLSSASRLGEAEMLDRLIRVGEQVRRPFGRAAVVGGMRVLGRRTGTTVQTQQVRTHGSAGGVSLQVPVGGPSAAVDNVGRNAAVKAHNARELPATDNS